MGRDDEGRRVVLGRIAGAHGVQGGLRVRVLGDGPEHLLGIEEAWISTRDREPETDPSPRHVVIRGAGAARPGEVRLELEGVDDRDAALALRGGWIVVPASSLPPLPEGEHYWYELVGCRVEDSDGRVLGTVRELWDTPGQDLLVVEDAHGREHLVPAGEPFVQEVDVGAGRIRIETIPGLIES